MEIQNNQKAKDKVTVANTYILIVTLTVNELNSPTERQSDWMNIKVTQL